MKPFASAAVIAVGLAALAAPRVAVAATTYEIVAKIPANNAYFVALDPALHRVYSPKSSLWVVDENTDSVIGLALPLLVAGISESIGYQVGACRAMRVFVSEVELDDGPFLTDVLATDWINQAQAIEDSMGCF
jgi:hypothetical protein